jgi:hypothetical protein
VSAGWNELAVMERRARLMYSEKSDRPLDCWKEVELFKAEVAKVEQVSCLCAFVCKQADK